MLLRWQAEAGGRPPAPLAATADPLGAGRWAPPPTGGQEGGERGREGDIAALARVLPRLRHAHECLGRHRTNQ
eukprot:1181384-Prorocentrum_minimum.AAC.1